MTTISLIMVVRNEERHIRAALLDIAPYVDEIVVVDQASTDKTKYIARELATVIIEHPNHGFAEASRPEAMLQASGDWLLMLDADERLSEFGKLNLHTWVGGATDVFHLRRLTTVNTDTIEDVCHPRLWRRNKLAAPPFIHVMPFAVPGAKEMTMRSHVVIEHFKTSGEQDDDDRRYRLLDEYE